MDPQHQITAADAKGKGLIEEGTSSGRPPRSGIVITHRRHRETWQRREITGTAHSLSIVGSKTLNCPLLGIALNRYDRPNRQYQNDDRRFNGPIRGRASVHDRLGGRLSVHDRLGDRVGYFPRNQEELEEMADA